MVDWDRVQELRSKGWDWADIAKDPKVDFHPDKSAGSPGRALRALYHRTGRRVEAAHAQVAKAKRPRKEDLERRWTLTRVGYALVPVVAVWFLLAYAAPSPVGLLVPAMPYLALVLAGVAFVLCYALWRKADGRRWTDVYRRTVIGGVVLGLVFAGTIGLAGAIIFGCPYLPPASTLSGTSAPGWDTGPLPTWQSNGAPVVFFYGATWCPYCSASSWAIYKALTDYGMVSSSSISLDHSSLSDVYAGTPEVVLASASLSPKNTHGPAVDFQAAEDTSGVDGTYPGTGSCFQQAYVTAYASGIPFVVLNGQYVHIGSLVDPLSLSPWNWANSSDTLSGAATVKASVLNETGSPWSSVEGPAWWIMALLAKILGYSTVTVSTLGSEYSWSPSTVQNVTHDLGIIT